METIEERFEQVIRIMDTDDDERVVAKALAAIHKSELRKALIEKEISLLHQYSDRIGLDAESRLKELFQQLKELTEETKIKG